MPEPPKTALRATGSPPPAPYSLDFLSLSPSPCALTCTVTHAPPYSCSIPLLHNCHSGTKWHSGAARWSEPPILTSADDAQRSRRAVTRAPTLLKCREENYCTSLLPCQIAKIQQAAWSLPDVAVAWCAAMAGGRRVALMWMGPPALIAALSCRLSLVLRRSNPARAAAELRCKCAIVCAWSLLDGASPRRRVGANQRHQLQERRSCAAAQPGCRLRCSSAPSTTRAGEFVRQQGGQQQGWRQASPPGCRAPLAAAGSPGAAWMRSMRSAGAVGRRGRAGAPPALGRRHCRCLAGERGHSPLPPAAATQHLLLPSLLPAQWLGGPSGASSLGSRRRQQDRELRPRRAWLLPRPRQRIPLSPCSGRAGSRGGSHGGPGAAARQGVPAE